MGSFESFLLELRVGGMCSAAISKVAAWWSEACLVTGNGENGAKMAKNLHRERTSQCIAGCADKRGRIIAAAHRLQSTESGKEKILTFHRLDVDVQLSRRRGRAGQFLEGGCGQRKTPVVPEEERS